MAGLWDKLRGKDAPVVDDTGAALRRLFGDYPPDPPAHAGPAATLTAAQQDENLAQFLAVQSQRLAVGSDYLRARGVSVDPMLDPAADGLPAARAVDAWLDEALPKRPFSPISGDETPNPDEHGLMASDRTGPDIYYSVLADLGRLEGEAIRRRDPRFDWAVNRLPGFEDMGSYGRICLIKAGDVQWAPTVLDMEMHMLGICHPKMAPRGNLSGHRFGELLEAAVTQAFDPHP
ncbi:hypothetical protein KCP91_05125 [Microvirga sp. SRT01]|uniref:Uncharacterized protein n=1 Tax=Sphingomonas longa TaxID=2778730 RepID=A0ABS2D4A1_9SPHN|nr:MULTISPECIES: hypothetical protein [Alphaproteobacteria]MBM6575745.1 hypothetical protein [Sphingomonas sp. BT552]MBR7708792.1 hypothetical protein [Microvirga sp. SRT01]